MISRAGAFALALLRIAAGLSLIGAGLHKLAWLSHPEKLEPMLTEWGTHPANSLITKYLAWVLPHHHVFARLVVVGELGLGLLLVLGLLTPLAGILGFLMVANFHFASSEMFHLDYLTTQSGLSFLLILPVLSLCKAGTALGLDGLLSGRARQGPPK